MKRTLFALLTGLVAIFFACNTPSPAPSDQNNAAKSNTSSVDLNCELLGNKQYDITVSTRGKVDGKEVLSFKNGLVESSECLKYGFAATPYTCTALKDIIGFEMIMTSGKEGKMTWKGKATATQVSGTILWVKAGQNDIAYTFEGPAK